MPPTPIACLSPLTRARPELNEPSPESLTATPVLQLRCETTRTRTAPQLRAHGSGECAECRRTRACRLACELLHLVERVGERRLQLERLFDLSRAHIRVFAVFEEARTLVFPDKLDKRRSVSFPILWKSFKIFEDRVDAILREESHGVLCVLIEVSIENALIHEVGLIVDVEEHPAQVMQLEHFEGLGKTRDRFFNLLTIRTDGLLTLRLDLRDDREAIARGSLREDRAVSALLHFVCEKSALGDRHGCGFRPIVLLRSV